MKISIQCFTLSILFFLLMASPMVLAQRKLRGIVKNEKGESLEFINVVVLDGIDSTLLGGAVSNESGGYELSVIKNQVIVRASGIGFRTYTSERLDLNDTLRETVYDIILSNDLTSLNEVVIKGSKQLIERKLGKLIINIGEGEFKTVNNSIALLSRLPELFIDNSGNLLFRGTIQPRIMLDNKSISLDELKLIPVSDIDKVEIISNPSANYDGDSRVIVNVILKKDRTLGLNGLLYAEVGKNRYYRSEVGTAIQYKTRIINYHVSIENYNYKFFKDINIYRSMTIPSEVRIDQVNNMVNSPRGQLYRGGLDWSINKKQILSFLIRGSKSNQRIGNSINTTNLNSYKAYFTDNKSHDSRNTFGLNLHYSWEMDSLGKGLQFDANYYTNDFNQLQEIASYDSDKIKVPFQSLNVGNNSYTSIYACKIDYTRPIDNKFRFDVGAKYSFVSIKNRIQYDTLNNGIWTSDYSRNNNFDYKEDIISGYALLTYDHKKNSLQLGIRNEYTETIGNSINIADLVRRRYNRFLPNFSYMYRLSDRAQVNLSFSRRITRPNYQDLNPFKFYFDPYTSISGNPFLIPVSSSQFELAVRVNNLNVSTYANIDYDVINQIPEQSERSNELQYIVRNTKKFELYGSSASFRIKYFDWWSSSNVATLKFSKFETFFQTEIYKSKRLAYVLQSANSLKLIKGVDIEVNFYYMSSDIQGVYRLRPVYALNVGARRVFFKERLDVKLNVSDLFYTYRIRQHAIQSNSEISISQRTSSCEGLLRIAYKFGSSSFSRKGYNLGSQEEQNRIK